MNGEKTRIRKFLLGSASEKDDETLGLRIMTDRDFDEKMSFEEEELIEDFLDDALTAEETELFKRNFLTTPARLEMINEIALVKKYARSLAANTAERETEEKKSGGLLESLKGFLTLNLRPVAAVLLVLVLAGVAWLVFFDERGPSEIEKTYASLNAGDLNDAPQIANLSTKSLLPGVMRGTGGADRLRSANLTESVLFSLALPPGTPAAARFDLELVRDDRTIFRQPNLRVYQNPNGQELKVLLPKAVMPAGAYQIKLSDGTNYAFAVE